MSAAHPAQCPCSRLRRTGLGIAVAIAMGACGKNAAAPPHEPTPIPVEVEVAAGGRIVDTITLNGEVRPKENTRLASGGGGKIDAVLIDDGDEVRKGELLLKVAGALATAQLHQAQAALASARAAHDRAATLAQKGMESRAAMDRATTSLAQAEAGAEMARARYDDAIIRAPHAGTVAKLYVSRGEQALPGAPLIDLVDVSAVDVVAHLPERDAPLFAVGREATLVADAFADEQFAGTVTRIGMIADRHSRTFDLEVRVDNHEGRLRPGMLARLRLVRRIADGVVVRRDAVVEDLDGSVAYVVRDGIAHRVPVTLGPGEDRRVIVESGIAAGDAVVVVGQRSLVDGQPVRIAAEHRVGEIVADQADPEATPIAKPQ